MLLINLIKKTGKTNNDGRIDIEIMVTLKRLCNFWRPLQMLLINCDFELILT